MTDRGSDRVMWFMFGALTWVAGFFAGFVLDHFTTWLGGKPLWP